MSAHFDELALARALEDVMAEPFRPERAKLAGRTQGAQSGPETADGHTKRLVAHGEIRLERNTADLLESWRSSMRRRLGVVGFGVGTKLVGAHKTDTLAIRFYVDKKRPLSDLDLAVPSRIKLPKLGAVPTDVVEVGRVRAQLNTERMRPAFLGCSIGDGVNAGTLGCFVRRKGDSEKVYVLSNSHVLARSGFASLGDEILQPAMADGGKAPADVIAKLSEFCPIDFTGLNEIDAALGEVTDPTAVTTILRLRGLALKLPIVKSPKVNQKVIKVGRTTDYSIAEILDVHGIIDVDYPTPAGLQTATFHNQILCTMYTSPGDSGSLVVTPSGRPVGLHFAGSDAVSVANPISLVLDRLGIEILT